MFGDFFGEGEFFEDAALAATIHKEEQDGRVLKSYTCEVCDSHEAYEPRCYLCKEV